MSPQFRRSTHLFTSESVTMGHPDKVADQISDAVLDAILTQDPKARVACETLVTTGQVVLAGEVTTTAYVDAAQIARETIKEIGYVHPDIGFDFHSCGVLTAIHSQSPDIARGVDRADDDDQQQDAMNDKAKRAIIEQVIRPVIPKKLWNDDIIFHINPTGKFVVGGPHGDTGLTGRKIIVDSYGGRGAHGGGAFSGKDPSKVDRSACYMGRYIAKNIVAAGLATSAEVQLAYAIGVAKPVSVTVSTEGTALIPEDQIAELVKEHFPLTPRGIIKHLDLLKPIYKETARHGHFGRIPGNNGSFSWEKT